MSRRGDGGSLFVGRLSKNARAKDLEDVFGTYGRMSRCDIKYGPDMGFAFIDFEDKRDAEDALRYENGRSICGNSIVVEWAKGTPRTGGCRPFRMDHSGEVPATRSDSDECYKCRRTGHIARDCRSDAPRGGRPRESRSRSRERRRSWSRERYRRRSNSRSPRRNGRDRD